MKNITLSRDTVEQWLEDLEFSDSDANVIAAIKQALAAPVQEPDAWVPCLYPGQYITLTKPPESWKMIPLYTTPSAAQPAPAQPPIPDTITDNSESPEYRAGWNDCRELTIQMRKS
jgi:hypothetical protein